MHSTTRFNGASGLMPVWQIRPQLARYGYPLSLIGFALISYLAARLSLAMPFTEVLITPVWPIAGIAFGAIYLYGYRLWPGLFAGLAVAIAQTLDHAELSRNASFVLIVGPAAIHTLEVMCSVWLVKHTTGWRDFLDRPVKVFRFVALVALVSAAGSSLVNIMLGASTELASDEFSLWATQWLGNVAGYLLIAPLLVALARPYALRWTTALAVEATLALLLTAVAAQILFNAWHQVSLSEPLPLPVVVLLLWVAIRFGMRELCLALLLVAAIAVQATLGGNGPYLADTPAGSMLLTLVFVSVTASGFLALGSALLENRRSTEALRDINFTLEQRVRQRTDALAHANQELELYRDRLEELVEERTADLELANREIESFSYSVSHDLRSPLRAIDGYSHALIEDYADQLDDTARGYLERSRAASQRMGLLIDDVLLLSRVTRHELELHRVDLTALARDVIREIEAAEAERKVDFVVHENLSVQGDEHLLRIVLENLLGNAWKYSARNPRARIELGMDTSGDEYIFFVRDNGIGFDMHYSDQLFGAFQRLHAPEEFEGTGIGLATVSRVMTRHGGRVWAEGRVNEGATFYFAFPERGRTTGPRRAIQLEDLDIAGA